MILSRRNRPERNIMAKGQDKKKTVKKAPKLDKKAKKAAKVAKKAK